MMSRYTQWASHVTSGDTWLRVTLWSLLLPDFLGSYSYSFLFSFPPSFLGWGPWASVRSCAGRMGVPRGKKDAS